MLHSFSEAEKKILDRLEKRFHKSNNHLPEIYKKLFVTIEDYDALYLKLARSDFFIPDKISKITDYRIFELDNDLPTCYRGLIYQLFPYRNRNLTNLNESETLRISLLFLTIPLLYNSVWKDKVYKPKNTIDRIDFFKHHGIVSKLERKYLEVDDKDMWRINNKLRIKKQLKRERVVKNVQNKFESINIQDNSDPFKTPSVPNAKSLNSIEMETDDNSPKMAQMIDLTDFGL